MRCIRYLQTHQKRCCSNETLSLGFAWSVLSQAPRSSGTACKKCPMRSNVAAALEQASGMLSTSRCQTVSAASRSTRGAHLGVKPKGVYMSRLTKSTIVVALVE